LTTVGGDALARSLNVTAVEGRAVTGPLAGLERNLFAAIGKNLTLHFVNFSNTREKLEALCEVIERKQVRPVIGASYPLERVAEAHRRLERGGEGVHGKIAIEVA
jgi:NADPH:quinone reductase-like Zn-dependent oxidoreductase